MDFRVSRIVWATMLLAAMVLGACGGQNDAEMAQQAFDTTAVTGTLPEGHPDVAGATAAGSGAVAGISWQVPRVWEDSGPRGMRVATYVIPAVEADSEAAECAVFYFGASQGGDVQANVDRWIGQFEQPDGSSSASVAKTDKMEVKGLPVTMVEVNGTYTAAMSPMSGGGARKENFRMQGAIVEGPEGAVFFKLTGPDKTVKAASELFKAMIRSVSTL